jgi:hypothetical protein
MVENVRPREVPQFDAVISKRGMTPVCDLGTVSVAMGDRSYGNDNFTRFPRFHCPWNAVPPPTNGSRPHAAIPLNEPSAVRCTKSYETT